MFSVVIPLYNKQDCIRDTVQSVLDQTFPDFEINIVDDGSTDRSLEIARQFDDPRIRVFSKPNGGVSSARNYGIKQSRKDTSPSWTRTTSGSRISLPKWPD